MAHADETDDSHGSVAVPPWRAIVPAAMAAGEKFGISGVRFLRAVALGYDVGPRVTMTMGGSPFAMKATEHALDRRSFRSRRGGGVRRQPHRAADALADRLYGAAVLRDRRLAA